MVARSYARAVRGFLRDLGDPEPPLHVIELAASSGRLAFAFLQAWSELFSSTDVPHLCYVLTATSADAVDAWRRHPQLAALAERGALDFACWDAEAGGSLHLLKSGAELNPDNGQHRPVAVIAHGAWRGMTSDAFAVVDGQLLDRRSIDDPRPIDLPFYDDPDLDGFLEQTRRELESATLILPVGACRALDHLAALAEGGLLLLSAERAPFDSRALQSRVEARGGRAVRPRTPPGHIAVDAYLLKVPGDAPATRESLAEMLDGVGPDTVLALARGWHRELPETDLDGVLAGLRLSSWDTRMAHLCLPRLHELARAGLAAQERAALADATERIWQAHFHTEDLDLAFELGSVLETAGLHRRAIAFFLASLERYGEHTATFYNLALCHLRLGEGDLARQCVSRALELDPDNGGARDLSRKLDALAAGEARRAEPPVRPKAPPPIAAYASNLEHLRGEVQLLNLRLAQELERWRSTHPPEAGPDQLRGERLSDLGADVALESLGDALELAVAGSLDAWEARATLHGWRERAALEAGTPLRLPELADRLGLDDFERQVVLLALAPELDQRYERLFGYLNDDVQRRWPTVDLALRLFTASPAERQARAGELSVASTLFDRRLLRTLGEEAPVPGVDRSRVLRLEARVLHFLLDRPAAGGNAGADPVLAPFLNVPEAEPGAPALGDAAVRDDVAELREYLATRPEPSPILALDGADALQLQRTATFLAGGGLIVLRGAAVATAPEPVDLAARALREVELTGRTLLVEDAAALRQDGAPSAALYRLLTTPCSRPRLLAAAEPWSLPETCRTAPLLTLHVPPPDQVARVDLWRRALGELADGLELGELAGRFRLRSAQIDAAAHRVRAHLRSRPADAENLAPTLYAACRAQCFIALDGLAQRIESVHNWDDLVVPRSVKAKLRGIENWLRYRHVVHHDWGFAERINAGRGMAAMFTGSSGTGKTMAAGILGRLLDLDLYRIDLSSVVSKYIGETEKNLARIFEAAEAANAVLFFDEADALFGKRSEVKDAHDRHANIEVSYLLQRMESYDGIAILATNIKDNLDMAFKRRLQVIVEFPFPSTADRERIWRRLLPEQVPQAEDVDLSFLAKQFGLAGGSIKNCALDAAVAAAAEGKAVAMRHLVLAVAREYEKLGKPVTSTAFGACGHLVS